MILVYTLSIVAMVAAESTTEEHVSRNYCQLPDPIFADGIQVANFGTDGWNYANAENWEQLVVTCGGSYQSPIDIVTTGASQQPVQPKIYYKNKASDVGYEEVNTPYTKEYEGEYSSIQVLDASGLVVRYYAKQFHIHTPSEHTIDGKHFDLEIHFVHQAIQDEEQDCNKVKNSLTVFGLMFTESASATDYEAFKPWFDQNMTGEVESFDLNDFFQKMTDSTYYHYDGSLTTLPCSQIVNWIVFYQPLPISTFQLNQFRATFADSTAFPLKQNNRPIQHLNGRKILKGVIDYDHYIQDCTHSWSDRNPRCVIISGMSITFINCDGCFYIMITHQQFKLKMILASILLTLLLDSIKSQRTYCQLPDPIFNDGVKNSTWGDSDPSDWNYLNTNDWKSKVVTCGASFQSPINIITSTATKESTFPAINYILKSSTKNYFEAQRDYTKELEGEYDFITAFDISNSQYKYYARQFHIHTPSEHQVDGKNFDLEVHFVHQAVEDGEQSCNDIRNKLTVFGLLFQQSNTASDYEVFKPWFDDTVNRVSSFDMNDFFQRMTDKTYYHYTGSLTTIPCSQTVNWYVFTSPLPISKSQFKQFKDFLDSDDYFPDQSNNRPVQNLNGRTLYKGTASFNGVTSLPVIEASWGSIIQMAMLLIIYLII